MAVAAAWTGVWQPVIASGDAWVTGRRRGWGLGCVDRSGGWLAAWSTSGGEWSEWVGVSTARGHTPVCPHPVPPLPIPTIPPYLLCREMVESGRGWARVGRYVQTLFKLLCRAHTEFELGTCLTKFAKATHNPQSEFNL